MVQTCDNSPNQLDIQKIDASKCSCSKFALGIFLSVNFAHACTIIASYGTAVVTFYCETSPRMEEEKGIVPPYPQTKG